MKKRERLSDSFVTEEDAEFQMAPMIDVVFQLLIFFMCVTTLQTIRVSKEVELPIASSAEKSPEKISQAIVNLEWQGAEHSPKVNINGIDLPYNEITPFLKAWFEHNRDGRIFLRADHRVRYHQVRDVMDACSKAGLGKIAFVSLQTPPRK